MFDQARDLQLVRRLALLRELAGDRVDAEAADGEERREAGPVLGDDRRDRRSSQSCAFAPQRTPTAPTPRIPRNTRRPTGAPPTGRSSSGVPTSTGPSSTDPGYDRPGPPRPSPGTSFAVRKNCGRN